MNISKQIKRYRKEFNVSQETLAEELKVSRQTISNWENDKGYPDLQNLIMLSDYFKVSLDELVKGDVFKMNNETIKKLQKKSGKTHTRKFIDCLTNIEEALKYGRVDTLVKIDDGILGVSNRSAMTNCLCEFTKEDININSYRKSFWFGKEITTLVKRISYDEIESVEFSIDRKFGTIFGGFPSFSLFLDIDIILKNKEVILLKVGSLAIIKRPVEIFNLNKVKVIDKFDFNKLYEEKTNEEVKEYLYSNYDEFVKNK